MEWKTRVTELFGCKYPILQGAYAGFGKWQFAAAVAEAGAHGCITAAASRTPEQLRQDIRSCRAATSGSFGVNLSLGSSLKNPEECLEVCIEEGVSVETAVAKPDALAPRIKEAGLTWIHKTARVKDAIHAEKLGADAIIIVGLEGTGFKSPEQLPTMLTTIWAKKELKVPFIAAGGLGDARGFLGALGMGADGIMMGTAFMTCKECPLKDSLKEVIVKVSPDNAQLRHRVLAVPDPKDLEEVMKLRDKMPSREWFAMLERVNYKDPDWRNPRSRPVATLDGRLRAVSLAAGVVDRVLTVKELIDSIVQGAEELLDSYEFLKTR
ncbi:NAD(P)H-dependent flavin oxidoreductase [Chloroflexota bacterium]